jgi:hypothetical protein
MITGTRQPNRLRDVMSPTFPVATGKANAITDKSGFP